MTRHTQSRAQLNQLEEGGYFNPAHRPPAEMLRPETAQLFTEWDGLRTRLGQAEGVVRDLTTGVSYSDGWKMHEAAAKKADADEAARAARTGITLEAPTAHYDALVARRDEAIATVEALQGARTLIMNDLMAAHNAEKANPAHTEREAKARAELRAALAKVATAAEKVAGAEGVIEWARDHVPYYTGTDLPLRELWLRADIATGSGTAASEPIALSAVLAAIANL